MPVYLLKILKINALFALFFLTSYLTYRQNLLAIHLQSWPKINSLIFHKLYLSKQLLILSTSPSTVLNDFELAGAFNTVKGGGIQYFRPGL